MAGRRSPQSPSLSQLTSQPETIPSCHRRSRHAKFQPQLGRHQRWIVERTIAWLNRCRRLAKDWENLNRTALAFLRLASIRLMLRKLCNPV
jgi:transposase